MKEHLLKGCPHDFVIAFIQFVRWPRLDRRTCSGSEIAVVFVTELDDSKCMMVAQADEVKAGVDNRVDDGLNYVAWVFESSIHLASKTDARRREREAGQRRRRCS